MTVCGLPGALLVTVNEPVLAPVADGVNRRLTWQLAPAANVAVQVELTWVKSPALSATPEIVSGADPPLVTVTDWAVLALPMLTEPKASAVAESVDAGVPPVPDSATVCGLPAALVASVSAPVRAPAAVGENDTAIVQFEPEATGEPQPLLVTAKSPVAEADETFNVALPVLVTLTLCGRLVVPVASAPKLSVAGEKLTAAFVEDVPFDDPPHPASAIDNNMATGTSPGKRPLNTEHLIGREAFILVPAVWLRQQVEIDIGQKSTQVLR